MDDAFPIPRIEDHIISQGQKRIFSIMDLKDAFHKVPLKVESRPLTDTPPPPRYATMD